MTFIIRSLREGDFEAWLQLRLTLWPNASGPEEEEDMRSYVTSESRTLILAEAEDGRLIAFLEANIRPYADGCDTPDVGYIEGWYVEEEFRRQGVGAALVRAAEEWARSKGCREMASDCLEDNEVSLRAHLALGYAEKERLIHFAKRL